MPCVTECTPQGKGKLKLHFDNGMELELYRSELRQIKPGVDGSVSEEDYRRLLDEIVGKRAKKRAMHLLEQMDRTERQLREKLSAAYPEECVDSAIEYVSRFHYLDDYRYACNYIRCHKTKYSKRQLMAKLGVKGVSAEQAVRALDEEYDGDETTQIREILAKRRFAPQNGEREFARNYRYLTSKGFAGDVVLRIMREFE